MNRSVTVVDVVWGVVGRVGQNVVGTFSLDAFEVLEVMFVSIAPDD